MRDRRADLIIRCCAIISHYIYHMLSITFDFSLWQFFVLLILLSMILSTVRTSIILLSIDRLLLLLLPDLLLYYYYYININIIIIMIIIIIVILIFCKHYHSPWSIIFTNRSRVRCPTAGRPERLESRRFNTCPTYSTTLLFFSLSRSFLSWHGAYKARRRPLGVRKGTGTSLRYPHVFHCTDFFTFI